MVNQQKGVQQEAAYSAVVLNDHMYPRPCLYHFFMFSTKGKLRIFQSHYQDLGSKSVDDAFDENWKQEVESKIRECCIMSSACEDSILDREIEPAEIARCLHSLKNNE